MLLNTRMACAKAQQYIILFRPEVFKAGTKYLVINRACMSICFNLLSTI